MSFIYKRLSELVGEEQKKNLLAATIERFQSDYAYRNSSTTPIPGQQVGTSIGGGFTAAADLFESRSTDTDEDEIPHINLIRRAVEDHLAVVVSNFPKAKMVAPQYLPGKTIQPWERDLRLMIIDAAQDVINMYMKAIMKDGDWQSESRRAVFQSGIFGVGYVMLFLDDTLDLRESYELRRLMIQEEFAPEDFDRINFLAKRISFKHIDSRDVYWEGGKRRHKDCLRVTVIEREATEVVREEYGDKVKNPALIKSGKFPYEVNESLRRGSAGISYENQTAIMTMWELEPMQKERVLTNPETGEEVTFPFTDWILHKIVIAGGELAEHEMLSAIPVEEDNEKVGPIKNLPVIPFYLKESTDHPYGYSMPLMLELSEKFINAMRAIIYKSAKRAVSAQGVVVNLPNMGEGDLEKINYVLEEGGVAPLVGNSNQPLDIRDMVMPLNYTTAPINPALMQAVSMEMDAFQMQSQTVDIAALSSARSGSAKRAQINAADRPKALSIETLGNGVRQFYEAMYEFIYTYHTDEVQVEIDVPGSGREVVTLNEPYVANTMVQLTDNPQTVDDFEIQQVSMTLNPTNITMYAETDTFGGFPLDSISRFQIAIALQQAGVLVPETTRDLVLEPEIKSIDDANRARLEQQQAVAQQALLAQQAIEDPSIQRLIGGGAPLESLASDVAQQQVPQGGVFG